MCFILHLMIKCTKASLANHYKMYVDILFLKTKSICFHMLYIMYLQMLLKILDKENSRQLYFHNTNISRYNFLSFRL